jgi:hypothetical protein
MYFASCGFELCLNLEPSTSTSSTPIKLEVPLSAVDLGEVRVRISPESTVATSPSASISRYWWRAQQLPGRRAQQIFETDIYLTIREATFK